MEYYGNNDWRDYHLAHHGVKGMHWGVRRYQPYSLIPRESGKRGKEIGEAKATLGGRIADRVKIRTQYAGDRAAKRFMSTKNAKTFGDKVSNFIGYKRKERDSLSRSYQHSKLAKASKSKLVKNWHENKAANFYYRSQHYNHMSSMSRGERAFNNLVYRRDYMKMPVQRMSGRTTTVGRQWANRVFTFGIAGHVLDARYKAKMNPKPKVKKPESKVSKAVKSTAKDVVSLSVGSDRPVSDTSLAIHKTLKSVIKEYELDKKTKRAVEDYIDRNFRH